MYTEKNGPNNKLIKKEKKTDNLLNKNIKGGTRLTLSSGPE